MWQEADNETFYCIDNFSGEILALISSRQVGQINNDWIYHYDVRFFNITTIPNIHSFNSLENAKNYIKKQLSHYPTIKIN